MIKQTLAFGLLAASTLGFAIAPANASDIQSSSQVIGSTTVAIDDSHANSYNTQTSYEGMYEGYDFLPYGNGQETQRSQQAIHSTTVAVDDSHATSHNNQQMYQDMYEDYGYNPYYQDQEAQLGNQLIQSTTVAVDDSTATSMNEQFSEITNFESGWGAYPYFY
jgi:hypothetical protein